MLILKIDITVILAKAGIQFDLKLCNKMDSRILTKYPLVTPRPLWDGNDGTKVFSVPLCLCGEAFNFKANQP
jgi:hypothetical protein